jgi:transcriptional regulator with XRE-family HTH domain
MSDNRRMGRRNSKGSISPQISKAARALLRLSQEEMAEAIGISSSTIRRFEGGIPMNAENDAKMIDFLKGSGIVFIHRDGDVVGLLQGDVEGLAFTS